MAKNNTTNEKLKNQSKRNIIVLCVTMVVVLVILYFAFVWTTENVLFKDFFKSYK